MRITTYEWVVEQMEGEDVLDTSGFDTLPEAQAYATKCDEPTVICLRRDVGEGPDREHLDIADRQYAYVGDTCFEYGALIPKHLLLQLIGLGALA